MYIFFYQCHSFIRLERLLQNNDEVCKQLTTVNSTKKQDYERRFHITRALTGLPPLLFYAAWVVTVVPVKLRGCRRHRVRVRRRNDRRRNGRCRDVPAPRSPSAETVSTETVVPRRWRRNGGAEMSCYGNRLMETSIATDCTPRINQNLQRHRTVFPAAAQISGTDLYCLCLLK